MARWRNNLLILIGSLAVAGLFATQAAAQQFPDARIAVVDMQHVYQSSLVGRDMQDQIALVRERFDQELQNREEALQKEAVDLERQGQSGLLSPQVYEVKRTALTQKVQELRTLRQQRSQQLQQMSIQALQELNTLLNPILQEMMQSQGINVFMTKSNVIRDSVGLEVTLDVIGKLDETVPAIKLEVPQARPVTQPTN